MPFKIEFNRFIVEWDNEIDWKYLFVILCVLSISASAESAAAVNPKPQQV